MLTVCLTAIYYSCYVLASLSVRMYTCGVVVNDPIDCSGGWMFLSQVYGISRVSCKKELLE